MRSFEKELISGHFEKAKHLSSHMDLECLTESLFRIAYDRQSLAPYQFVHTLLLEKETAELHYAASFLLSMALNHLEDAYQTAFVHATRACELAPTQTSYLEHLLYFYELPEPLLSKDQAMEIAARILEYDPNNKAAASVLND
ncbi:hypothetical protein ACFQPF_14845 [Fictibacillus iocasae]|uniref:Immunity protein 30 domain-containing protein n=1 Tax=Fictibacillus iocasae TaxID=2715437 RepID=A0ABW2NQS7_9BACL